MTKEYSTMISINELQSSCHERSLAAGWWNDLNTGEPQELTSDLFLAKMCLVHSELSESIEAHRKGLNDDHLIYRRGDEVEIADAIIRLMDIAGAWNLDISGAIMEKLEYNRTRADHKIENRKKDGGKKS